MFCTWEIGANAGEFEVGEQGRQFPNEQNVHLVELGREAVSPFILSPSRGEKEVNVPND